MCNFKYKNFTVSAKEVVTNIQLYVLNRFRLASMQLHKGLLSACANAWHPHLAWQN